MRKSISFVILAATLTLAACNTVQGVGEDVSSAGDTVANTAEKAK